MQLPTNEQFLSDLQRKKREIILYIAAAEMRGDLKEARALQAELRNLNSMIQKKGGNPDA